MMMQNDNATPTRCAGKIGTVLQVDLGDQSAKVRVIVMPGRADELWFGAGLILHQ
jgi:hypothetical protein